MNKRITIWVYGFKVMAKIPEQVGMIQFYKQWTLRANSHQNDKEPESDIYILKNLTLKFSEHLFELKSEVYTHRKNENERIKPGTENCLWNPETFFFIILPLIYFFLFSVASNFFFSIFLFLNKSQCIDIFKDHI